MTQRPPSAEPGNNERASERPFDSSLGRAVTFPQRTGCITEKTTGDNQLRLLGAKLLLSGESPCSCTHQGFDEAFAMMSRAPGEQFRPLWTKPWKLPINELEE